MISKPASGRQPPVSRRWIAPAYRRRAPLAAIVLVISAAVLSGPTAAWAQNLSDPPSPGPSFLPLGDPLQRLPPQEAREVLQWAADWVRQVLPQSYHGEKDWGKKTRVYAGVKVDVKDGRLSTHRRWKELHNGRWLRYDVHLRDPADPGRLDIRITRAEQGEDQRIRFEAQIDTLLDLELHQERWNLGTRLFSVSVKAEAKLRMMIAGDVGFEFDLTRIPPDILADPKIVSTDLVLVDLNVSRISKIGGELADAVGDIAKRIIREEYLPRQQAELATKLNAQIDRRRDRLRFGASEWVSRSLPIR